MSTKAQLPLLYRTPSTCSIISIPLENQGAVDPDNTFCQLLLDEGLKANSFSPCGRYFVYALQSKGLYVYSFEDESTHFVRDFGDGTNIHLVQWSPLSNFICIYTKISQSLVTTTQDNCFIWSLPKKSMIFSFANRNTNNWTIQWTCNESFFVRFSHTPGELIITNTISPDSPCFLFKDPTITSFSLSPSESSPKIALFFTGIKGAPSSIRIYAFPGGLSTAPKIMKSFYKADRVELLWNFSGSHLIAFIHSDEDRNGKSYYGHSSIIFISCDGKVDSQLSLDSEGPIHNVEWSPVSNEFIIVYGAMPARAKLFDSNCRPVFDFGASPKNFVKFNTFGNLICMGGFGNLSGSVEIWDRIKLKKIHSFKAPGTTTIEWSPNGRYLLFAILSPRLRVDNGIKIFDISGSVIFQMGFKELLQASWKPFSRGAFPIIQIDSILSSQPVIPIEKKKAYVPPSLRKSNGETTGIHLTKVVSDTINQPQKTQEKISPKEKVIKNLTTKLKQIELLKKKQTLGDSLELNQLEKIAKEVELLGELAQLTNLSI